MYFVTSDHHFYHAKILEYENRPFKNVDEMNMELVCRWNSVVGPNDHVFHLGDFGLGKIEDLRYILALLNGRKTLIRGNHDRSANKMLEIGFDSVCTSWHQNIFGAAVFMIHDPSQASRILRWHYDFVLYGHLHSKRDSKYDNMEGWVNCCVENSDYYPIPLEKIINKEYDGGKRKIQEARP